MLLTVMSVIVILRATLGWRGADPAAALAMVSIIVTEGLEGGRREAPCEDCC